MRCGDEVRFGGNVKYRNRILYIDMEVAGGLINTRHMR